MAPPLIIPLIAGAAGLAQAGQGIGQSIKARRELKKLEGQRPDLSAPKFSTPGEYFQAYKDAYNQDIMNRQLESVRAGLAGTTEALAGAGGRALLGGIGAATQQAARQSQGIADIQNKQQLEALQNLASAQERTRNLQAERDLQSLQMREQRSMGQIAAAQQGVNAGIQNIMSGLGSVGGAAMMFADPSVSGLLSGIGGKKSGGGTTAATTMAQGTGGGINRSNINFGGGSNLNTVNTNLPGMGMPARYNNMRINKHGGVLKTPGEFSHKTNPIDIMKDGKKIGEATGGEYIFNPKQMSNIKRFVNNGDKSRLHSYVRSLIKKFER